MQAVLTVTVPFFALVLCGYLAARRGLLPEAAIPGLNAFVLYFALPCLLMRFGMNTPLRELLNPSLLALYAACALLMVFFTISVSLNSRVQLKDAAFGALVAAFPNTGFMGVPLLVALLGPAAAGPVICTVLADLLLTSSLCIAVAQSASDDKATATAKAGLQGWRGATARALRGALSNPLPWAIAIGAVLSVAGITLPGPLDVMVSMLASAATPVALFTIGAVLWRAGLHTHTQTPLRDYVPVALIKLFVHPLLIFSVASAARSLGAPVTVFQITVLTLAAALPSASNVSLLAERYAADNGRIARIIMASTVLAFVSFSSLAWLFGVGPAR
jgi:malonate transporter and related proteins